MPELKGWISAERIRPRPAEVYKIRIGRLGAARSKADGGKFRLPEKLPYFRITRREREEHEVRGNFVRADEIHEKIGDEPTELKVFLVSDDPEECFFSQFQVYKGRTLALRCDGETAEILSNGKTGRCMRDSEGGCQCKPYGRLQVALETAPTLGSVAVFRTTSIESVSNIQYSLAMLRETFGFLRGLPCLLRVYPAEVQFQQGGELRTSTAYKVALELRATPQEARELKAALIEERLVGTEEQKLLQAARQAELDELDEAEREEIAKEFHPDPNDIASVETKETIERIKEEKGISGEVAEAEPDNNDADVQDTGEAEGVSPEEFFTDEEREQAKHYTCEACRSVFGSPQALGGHKAHCQGPAEEEEAEEAEAEEADDLPMDRESLLELGFRYAGALSKKPGFFGDRARELFPDRAGAGGVVKLSELGLAELRDVVLSLQTEAEATLPEGSQGALL